ncbi:MAG: hypothetical protein LBU20_01235 [Candidatus Nomurabacteria bacterium]|nr:hypothetical protein [Candidatus Nomurabacteria bacterium]
METAEQYAQSAVAEATNGETSRKLLEAHRAKLTADLALEQMTLSRTESMISNLNRQLADMTPMRTYTENRISEITQELATVEAALNQLEPEAQLEPLPLPEKAFDNVLYVH